MARVSHTPVEVPQSTAGTVAAVAFAAADATNKEQVTLTGRELLLVRNAGASAHTITVTSVNDPYGRKGDLASVSVPAGEYRVCPLFALTGWLQSDGKLYFEADSNEVEFVVLRLP